MSARDLYLVSPALSLAILATALVLAGPLLRRSGAVQAVALAGLSVPLALGVSLWAGLDGAEAAFGGALVSDGLSVFLGLLVTCASALVLLASFTHAERYRPYGGEFAGLLLFSAAGLTLLAGAADLLTIYVSLELASLPVAALAAFAKGRAGGVEAGVKYLLLSAVASAVLLYGFAFLYGATGTLRLIAPDGGPTIATAVVAGHGGFAYGGSAVLVGAALAAVGFGFKLSMVPAQMWTPDVYQGAPVPVGAFLAVASKGAAFAVVLRLFTVGLGPVEADWSVLFAVLAAITMTVGNLTALAQSNLKRLLGYSTIAHAGYMLMGVAAVAANSREAGDGSLGPTAVLFYLAGYAAMNLAAFFVALAVTERTGDETIAGLAGLAKRSPVLAAALAVSAIALTGLPPTVGFVGKLFLFNAAVNTGLLWLVVVGALNGVVSAYYYLNLVRVAYLREPVSPERIGVPRTLAVALGVCVCAVLVLGVWPSGLLALARTAAAALVP
ncbi:MAG: NADH-quinone oxidoreductase subunit N [Chloroflexota bacterium]